MENSVMPRRTNPEGLPNPADRMGEAPILAVSVGVLGEWAVISGGAPTEAPNDLPSGLWGSPGEAPIDLQGCAR